MPHQNGNHHWTWPNWDKVHMEHLFPASFQPDLNKARHIYPVNNLDKSWLCQIVTYNGKTSVIVTGGGEIFFEQQEFPDGSEIRPYICYRERPRDADLLRTAHLGWTYLVWGLQAITHLGKIKFANKSPTGFRGESYLNQSTSEMLESSVISSKTQGYTLSKHPFLYYLQSQFSNRKAIWHSWEIWQKVVNTLKDYFASARERYGEHFWRVVS